VCVAVKQAFINLFSRASGCPRSRRIAVVMPSSSSLTSLRRLRALRRRTRRPTKSRCSCRRAAISSRSASCARKVSAADTRCRRQSALRASRSACLRVASLLRHCLRVRCVARRCDAYDEYGASARRLSVTMCQWRRDRTRRTVESRSTPIAVTDRHKYT
jgi:hypothetical protein